MPGSISKLMENRHVVTIADLPVEILALIAGNFQPHEAKIYYRQVLWDLQTLAGLPRVNKKWKKAATPVLYRVLMLRALWKSPPMIIGMDVPDENAVRALILRTAKLLKTLIQQPDRARHVRRILTEFYPWKGDETERKHNQPFGSAIDELPLTPYVRGMLMAENEYEVRDRQCALLLLLCDRVRDLRMSWIAAPGSLVMQATAGFPNSSDGVFSDGRNVSKPLACTKVLHVSFRQFYGHHSEWQHALQLPELNRLSVRNSLCMEHLQAPCYSACRAIHLYMTYINASGFRFLLMSCPNLEKLFLDWHQASEGDGVIVMDWTQFGSALRQYGRKLSDLRLIPQINLYEEVFRYQGTVGDLKFMTSLRNLCIPFHALVRESNAFPLIDETTQKDSRQPEYLNTILPTSVQTLHLANAQGRDGLWEDPTYIQNRIQKLTLDARLLDLRRIKVFRTEGQYLQGLLQSNWRLRSDDREHCFILERSNQEGIWEDDNSGAASRVVLDMGEV